jgi:hypothetical protein
MSICYLKITSAKLGFWMSLAATELLPNDNDNEKSDRSMRCFGPIHFFRERLIGFPMLLEVLYLGRGYF